MLPLRVLATAALLAGLTAGCTVPGYSFGNGGAGGADASTDGAGGSSGGTAGTGPDAGCHGDQDCIGSTPRCNTATGKCVQCLPTDDTCPLGKYCALPSYTCQPGCKTNAECNDFDGGAGTATCTNHKCHCTQDDDCQLGTLCTSTLCIPGCNAQHGCPTQQDCCSGQCKAINSDVNNCGSCGHACAFDPTNSSPNCVAGKCTLTCQLFLQNCDNNLGNGCESDSRSDPKNCNGCGSPCPANKPVCVNRTCTSADAG